MTPNLLRIRSIPWQTISTRGRISNPGRQANSQANPVSNRAREEKRIRTTPHRRFHLPAKRKTERRFRGTRARVGSAERRSRLEPIAPGQPLSGTFSLSFSPQGLFEPRLSKPNAYRPRGCLLSVSSLRSHCGQWGSGRVHSLPASVKNVAFVCSSSVPHLRQ